MFSVEAWVLSPHDDHARAVGLAADDGLVGPGDVVSVELMESHLDCEDGYTLASYRLAILDVWEAA